MEGGVFEVFGLHGQLGLQLVYLCAVDLLQAGELVLEAVVVYGQVLVLVEEVVDLELQFRGGDILATELVLQLYQLVLELNAHFALVVQLMLVLLLGLPELLALVLEHELDLTEVVIVVLRD